MEITNKSILKIKRSLESRGFDVEIKEVVEDDGEKWQVLADACGYKGGISIHKKNLLISEGALGSYVVHQVTTDFIRKLTIEAHWGHIDGKV